jgi:putative transposase
LDIVEWRTTRYFARVVIDGRTFWRKPNRLAAAVYKQPLACSLTLVTAGRVRAFASHSLTSSCLAQLEQSAARHSVAILAYCFVPDHVHLLMRNGLRSSLIAFVKDFKQFTGYNYKKATGVTLWQKSYFDHFIRSDEDLVAIARYIFANPVRAGIVARAEDYPFSGSFEWPRAVLVEG